MTTTPTDPATGDLRAVYEAMAAVLRDLHRDHSGHPNSTSEAEALLPVVESYGRACAAAALRDEAAHWERCGRWDTGKLLRARADDLQATP